MVEIAEQIAHDWQEIKRKRPLLHHITNFVVMNETANVTLCTGALPVMAHAQEEVAEMVQMAGALVLNIGTLTPRWIESMLLAGKRANELDVPVILDPVGVGATKLRTDSANQLLDELKIAVIRGNAAEVSILAGHQGEIKGVESVEGVAGIEQVAKEFAQQRKLVVAITGKEDVVTDGQRLALIKNGDAMLSTITGTGCMATTVIGAFCAVNRDYFVATVGGLTTFGLAGEIAAQITQSKPGSFHVALYDSLAGLKLDEIITGAKLEVI